jgi:hypothetical protein
VYEDDPLHAILARHLTGSVGDTNRPLGPEPAIMSDICDATLTVLGSLASLVGMAQAALLTRRARLGQPDPGPGTPSSHARGPIRIPIQLLDSESPAVTP